jgi:ribosomal protein L21E
MGEDIPPPIEVICLEDNEDKDVEAAALNSETTMNPEIQFRYASNHPMGSILLKLLNENMKLAEKIGHRQMDLSAQELCTQFYNWQLSEKQKIKNRIMQTTAGLEDSILTREINSHTINQSIEAPAFFSAAPTLLTPRQRADCFKLLPSGSNKFSGSKGGVSILEYLNNLRSFQAQCRLSLPEFYEAMLASTTGNAYLLINSWIDNGEDPSTIFHNLLVHYDTRLQPEEARAKLMAYRAPKSSDLGKVEAYIMSLASRASSSIPAGPGRTANYNMEVIQGLIRALPHSSSLIVQNQNSERMAKHGRMLTAAELSRYLNIYRHTIDQDIKAHGVEPRAFEKRFSSKTGKVGARKFSAYNITGAAPLPHRGLTYQEVLMRPSVHTYQVTQNRTPVPIRPNKPFRNDFQNRFNNNGGTQRVWNNNYKPDMRNNRNNRTTGFRGNKQRTNFTPRRPANNFGRQNANKVYCSLCGKSDHVASSGCRFMISDKGERIAVMPTKAVCGQCPTFVNPRLSHPENLCPYRKGGPWGRQ